MRTQLTDFRVPDVMEYVTEKADLYEIQRKVKNWERKVEIAEVWNYVHFFVCKIPLMNGIQFQKRVVHTILDIR